MHINKVICFLAVLILASCASATNESNATQKSSFVYIGKVLEAVNGPPCVGFEVELRDLKYKPPLFHFEEGPPILVKTLTDTSGVFKLECSTYKESYAFYIGKVGRSSMIASPVSVTETNIIIFTTDPANRAIMDRLKKGAVDQQNEK